MLNFLKTKRDYKPKDRKVLKDERFLRSAIETMTGHNYAIYLDVVEGEITDKDYINVNLTEQLIESCKMTKDKNTKSLLEFTTEQEGIKDYTGDVKLISKEVVGLTDGKRKYHISMDELSRKLNYYSFREGTLVINGENIIESLIRAKNGRLLRTNYIAITDGSMLKLNGYVVVTDPRGERNYLLKVNQDELKLFMKSRFKNFQIDWVQDDFTGEVERIDKLLLRSKEAIDKADEEQFSVKEL